mgnify:CR=1 FL=1
MRKTLVYGLAVLLSGTVQAAATDDYLNGLKALDAGRQSEGLYLLEQAAVAGMPEAQFRHQARLRFHGARLDGRQRAAGAAELAYQHALAQLPAGQPRCRAARPG